jgi:hypothetical protein
MTTHTATVVFDVVSWRQYVEGTSPKEFTHESAYRGETVELPAAEFDRLSKLGGVVAGTDASQAIEEFNLETGPLPPGAEGDAVLAAMKAPDLVAYVTQNPDEAKRVWDVEHGRGEKARVTVYAATGLDPETGEPIA